MRRLALFVGFVLVLLFLGSCATRRPTLVERIRSGYYPYRVMKHVNTGFSQYGTASWYGRKFQGRRTASGEIYNMYAHTAAHRTLPFGTYVRVENLRNHRKTVVRINDRGPFVGNRIIDLSYAAARDIGLVGSGTAPVKITVLGSDKYGRPVADDDPSVASNVQPHGGFVVQVGSFRKLVNALRMRDSLSRYLSDVRIRKSVTGKGVFYRVIVGDFSTKREALNYARRKVVPIVGDCYVTNR